MQFLEQQPHFPSNMGDAGVGDTPPSLPHLPLSLSLLAPPPRTAPKSGVTRALPLTFALSPLESGVGALTSSPHMIQKSVPTPGLGPELQPRIPDGLCPSPVGPQAHLRLPAPPDVHLGFLCHLLVTFPSQLAAGFHCFLQTTICHPPS